MFDQLWFRSWGLSENRAENCILGEAVLWANLRIRYHPLLQWTHSCLYNGIHWSATLIGKEKEGGILSGYGSR